MSRPEFQEMTEEEYLKSEEKASQRHEFVDGHVFAMAGATNAHGLICGNVFYAIRGRLGASGPCKVHQHEMKLRIRSCRSYYYPDILVSCEELEAKSVFVDEPVLLVEVLSQSTSQIDRREKLLAYKKIASLKEYLIIYQDQQRIDLHHRTEKGWNCTTLTPAGEELVLESVPSGSLPLPWNLIYEGLNPPMRVKENEGEYTPRPR